MVEAFLKAGGLWVKLRWPRVLLILRIIIACAPSQSNKSIPLSRATLRTTISATNSEIAAHSRSSASRHALNP
jgi:hypothetical protein